MVTPWGSHMGGEEYEPDARLLEAATSVNGPEETSFASLDEDGAATLFDYVRVYEASTRTRSRSRPRARRSSPTGTATPSRSSRSRAASLRRASGT